MVVSIFWEADFVGLENPQFDTITGNICLLCFLQC